MYLGKKESLELVNNGFKRDFYTDKPDEKVPYDFYDYKDTEWVLGGKILPTGNLLSPREIYDEGTWLISTHDMLNWLCSNDINHEISYNGLGYKVIVLFHEKSYKAKGGTLEFALYKVILLLLKEYGANPSRKKYEVIKAEFINKETL